MQKYGDFTVSKDVKTALRQKGNGHYEAEKNNKNVHME